MARQMAQGAHFIVVEYEEPDRPEPANQVWYLANTPADTTDIKYLVEDVNKIARVEFKFQKMSPKFALGANITEEEIRKVLSDASDHMEREWSWFRGTPSLICCQYVCCCQMICHGNASNSAVQRINRDLLALNEATSARTKVVWGVEIYNVKYGAGFSQRVRVIARIVSNSGALSYQEGLPYTGPTAVTMR